MKKTHIATFENTDDADRCISRLYEEGLSRNDISMLVSDDASKRHLAIVQRTKAPEGMAGGAATGGLIGAIAAGLTAVAGIALPGLGVMVAGPIIAALIGAGAGGAVGGLVGGLVGLGFNENEAKLVEDAVRKGNVVLAVTDEGNTRSRVIHGIFESTRALSVAAA